MTRHTVFMQNRPDFRFEKSNLRRLLFGRLRGPARLSDRILSQSDGGEPNQNNEKLGGDAEVGW